MVKYLCFAVVVLMAAAPPASADYIYLKNGKVLEVIEAKVEGDYVVFTIFNGNMAIELSAVARIEKTSTQPSGTNIPGLDSSSPPLRVDYQGQSVDEFGASEMGETQEDEEKNPNEDLINYYIQEKKNLELQIAVAREQIKTLDSVIYAKSANFMDTTEERRRQEEFEAQIRDSEDRIDQIYSSARRDGLSPGEIRRIEDAHADISRQTLEEATRYY